MEQTDNSKLKLEVLLSQLSENQYDVERTQHQKILLVLHKFSLTCKDMGIDAQTALPILLSKHVFKESATMHSLIDNVNAKLREFKEYFQNPVDGFSFDDVQVRLPHPHDHGNIPPGAAPATIRDPYRYVSKISWKMPYTDASVLILKMVNCA